MSTQVSSIITSVRNALNEQTANFWSDAELVDFINKGVHDLWRSIADLKQEHFLVVNNDVILPLSGTSMGVTLSNVPIDVHKIVLIEALNGSETGANPGLHFQPLEYNHERFTFARARNPITPSNDTIYYDIHGAGAPIVAPTIRCAPGVTAPVNISFVYVPTLPTLTSSDPVPIPGEADQALVAWALAYARAKEREDRAPDGGWLAIYATEKTNLLESLGLRQYQEPKYADAQFEEYWG